MLKVCEAVVARYIVLIERLETTTPRLSNSILTVYPLLVLGVTVSSGNVPDQVTFLNQVT